jgi:hypothetical protein
MNVYTPFTPCTKGVVGTQALQSFKFQLLEGQLGQLLEPIVFTDPP